MHGCLCLLVKLQLEEALGWQLAPPWTSLFALGKAGDAGNGSGDGEFICPVAAALVPGLGLVVRDYLGARLQVFSTPDMVAMRRMAPIRVAWMVATACAIFRRSLSSR